eukprot:NODE_17475_length_940_cov_6.063961.p1 GENE.NODE_17475_length_940_cov_6.063961~~NODE_17475_length_940_cov_6.063961.p1  ORF type:complete len:113 (-),score=34.83 NODE_17475_length_940_cov_6.063961:480-818(-)
MGKSIKRLLSEKLQKRAGGYHWKKVQKKILTCQKNQMRRKAKRTLEKAAVALAEASEMKDDDTERLKRYVKPGFGTGTVGARFAAAKLKPAVRISKRGGRRKKWTLASVGHK